MTRKKTAMRQSRSYKVGKGRPPVATRWKPGQSGNRKGRPKGARNLVTIFNDALNQKIEIQDKGKTRKITVREGIVLRVINQSLKGDLKATAFVLAKEPEIARETRQIEKITSDMSPIEASKVYLRMIRGDDTDS